MPKTMAFRVVGNILVTVHGEQPPSDEDFKTYIDFVKNEMPAQCRASLVVSRGPGPSSVQRKMTTDVLKARGLANSKVAVATDSQVVRGIVTALGWFNPNIRAFSIADINQAIAYLDASPQLAAQIGIEVRRLSTSLGQDALKG